MSLVQAYRSRQGVNQNRWLLGYFGLALILHGVGGLLLWRSHPWLKGWSVLPTPPTPIDFVYLESTPTASPPPSTTTRQSQSQSIAHQSIAHQSVVHPSVANRSSSVDQAATDHAATDHAATGAAKPSTAASTRTEVGLGSESSPVMSRQPSRRSVPSGRQLQRSSPAAPTQPSDLPASPSLTPSPRSATSSRSIFPNQPIAPAAPNSPPSAPATARSIVSEINEMPPRSASLANPAHGSQSIGSAPSRMPVSAGSELDRVAQTGAGLQSLNQSDRADTGTTLDATVDPIWGAYLAGLNQLIDQHWQRVAVASTRRTQIRFRVDRQGRVTGLQIMQTSGDPVADQAALEAVRAAAPFAPLPQNAPEEVLTVNFTFTRWLNPASP